MVKDRIDKYADSCSTDQEIALCKDGIMELLGDKAT